MRNRPTFIRVSFRFLRPELSRQRECRPCTENSPSDCWRPPTRDAEPAGHQLLPSAAEAQRSLIREERQLCLGRQIVGRGGEQRDVCGVQRRAQGAIRRRAGHRLIDPDLVAGEQLVAAEAAVAVGLDSQLAVLAQLEREALRPVDDEAPLRSSGGTEAATRRPLPERHSVPSHRRNPRGRARRSPPRRERTY